MKTIQIQKRADEDLVGIDLVMTDAEDFSDPYHQVAPGLYPDEVAYQFEIDDNAPKLVGETVAVSVLRKRIEGRADTVVVGWARWIEPDGSTKRDTAGQEVELEFRHSLDARSLAESTPTWFSRQVLHALLGLPTENGWNADVLDSINIRFAIQAAKVSASPDPSTLLAI